MKHLVHHTFVLLVSLALLLCFSCVPIHGDTSTTLYNKTIDVPFTETCMAARMEYVSRNKDCARQHVDALQHYERRGHADGILWRSELCSVNPIYVNDSFCQCQAAIQTYVSDNPTVLPQDAWDHYLENLDTLARTWHCEKCIGNHSDLCISARRDYRLRYNLNNTIEPAFHYYTVGIYQGNYWNSTSCYPANMSSVIYMDSNVSNCVAGESWYDTYNPNARNLTNGGFPTGYQHYIRYSMEFGAYWYEELCVDVENECKTGRNNCSATEVCSNLLGDLGSFSCACLPGYVGTPPCYDFNECARNSTNNCSPFATCTNTNGSYYCTCFSGYTGSGLDCADIDECGLGISNCSSIQQCENTIGGYHCKCPLFYDSQGDYGCDYDCAFPFKSCAEGWCIPLETAGGVATNSSSSCTVGPPCHDSSPYHCTNGSCAQTVTTCTTNHSQPIVCNATTLCWDGSCATSVDVCPTLPECPATLRRCLDGACNATCATTTCAAPNQVCLDGLCAKTCATNWNGCPQVLPVMCPNGVCTNNVSTCVTGEFTVARTLRAQVMSVFFPVGSVGPSETNITIPVLSESGVLLFTLVLGESFFENQPGILIVAPVPDSQAYAAGKPLWGAGFEPSSKIFSAPVEIYVNGSGLVSGKNMRVNFNSSILSSIHNVSELCVGVINETSHQWMCHSALNIAKDSIYGSIISGKMAIIFAPGVSAVANVAPPRRERTVGIYLFAGIVVLYCMGLIFASLRDRKVFIEIVQETIKREGSVTAITGIPYQPAASEEPQESLESTQREMVKRGITMPNIVLSDEMRRKRMAHTKHAVVLSGDRSSMSIPHQPDTYFSKIGPERTARAMTFDSAYQHHHMGSIYDPTVSPAIPPFNPQRVRRSGPITEAAPSPVTFAPEVGLQSSFRLSGRTRNSKTAITFGTSHSSNSSEEDPQALELDDLSKSTDLISVPSPTPLVPRLAHPDVMVQEQARKLEWEVNLRAHTGTEVDLKKMSLWNLMKMKHTWLSVFFTQRTSRLTCVEQLTILLCMVMGTLGISAPFFHNLTDFNISKCIIVAIISATLVLVVTIFITIMFQNVIKTIYTLAVFGIALVFSCFCIALAMSYSYNFVLNATEMWIVTFAIACVQDVLVNQPFKVLVIALIYGSRPTDHWLVKLL